MTTAESDTHEISYTYDMDGIRDSKMVDGVTYNYITQNGKVVRQTWGNNTMDIIQETAQYYLANEPAPAPVKKPKEELAFIPIFVPIGLPLGSCPNYYGNFGSGLHNSYFCLR